MTATATNRAATARRRSHRERLYFTLPQFAEIAGWSETQARHHVVSLGCVPHFRIGARGRIRIGRHAALRWAINNGLPWRKIPAFRGMTPDDLVTTPDAPGP